MMEAATMQEPRRWPLEASPDGNKDGIAGGYVYEATYSVSSRAGSPPIGMEVEGTDARGGAWDGQRSEGGDTSIPSKRRHRRTYKELNRNIRCPHQNCGRVYASDSSLQTHVRLKHNNSKRSAMPSSYMPPVPMPAAGRPRTQGPGRLLATSASSGGPIIVHHEATDPRYPYDGPHMQSGPPPPPPSAPDHLSYDRTYTYHPEHTPTSPGAPTYRRHHSAQPYPIAAHHYQTEHAHPSAAPIPPPHPLSAHQPSQSTYPTRHHSTPTLSAPPPEYYQRRPSHPMDLTAHPYPSNTSWGSPPSHTYPPFRYSEPERYNTEPQFRNASTPIVPGAVPVPPPRQPQQPPLHRPYADSDPTREAHAIRPEYETTHTQSASPTFMHAPPPPHHASAHYYAPQGETGVQAQSKYDYEMQGQEKKTEQNPEARNGGVYYESEEGSYHYDVYRNQQVREEYAPAPAAGMEAR